MSELILAGDIGGTKSHLGLFHRDSTDIVEMKTFSSGSFSNFPEMIRDFLAGREMTFSAMCFGAAGPVINGVCKITNLDWAVDSRQVGTAFKCPKSFVINDLEANGNGIAVLPESSFHRLQKRDNPLIGNGALVSAGTGLGECMMFWDGTRHIPVPSEGGHNSFSPCNEEEVELLRFLWGKYDHVSWERVVSGSFGFENLYCFLRETGREAGSPELETMAGENGFGAAISHFADEGLPIAVRAMRLFVSLYGSEAGNLALKSMATVGLFIGGGIAPKILKWMQNGDFLKAFSAKGRFQRFLESVPVSIILEERTALLGAARYAMLHS